VYRFDGSVRHAREAGAQVRFRDACDCGAQGGCYWWSNENGNFLDVTLAEHQRLAYAAGWRSGLWRRK
jgi:hypothetical protein